MSSMSSDVAMVDAASGTAMPLHRVHILGSESIVVGSNLTHHIATDVITHIPASTYVVITDENVAPLHLDNLLSELQTAIADSCLIALGGGVLGDLVGFVAATFMRGIPVVQVPTTLLAMVDSSVGGKTAIDTPNGKNLIGAFHQPRRIFIDIRYLMTLKRREFVNGLAEVIKTAAIWDESDFEMLENYSERILGLIGLNSNKDDESVALLIKLILGSVKVKAHVVTVDEKETGLRGLLNFGHTVGHAIEAIAFPDLLHGECVAIGMVKEAEISRHLGHLNNVSVGRLVRCLQAYGLPVSIHDKHVSIYAPRKQFPVDRLLDIMRVDKKNQGDRKRIVLLSSIGKTLEPRASFVADNIFKKILSPSIYVTPPSRKIQVQLAVPGSKSISNRALVMAALGNGDCRLRGLLHSDDVQVMLDALHKLVGITYTWEDNGNTLLVTGGGGKLRSPQSEIYLGNAGTASRFLTTVCTLIRSTSVADTAAVLTGNDRMKQRPIGPLVKSLSSNGCDIQYLGTHGCLPISIKPCPSGLPGGTIHLSASVSSQYVSSILISAPYASSPVTLDLDGDTVVSQPYIDMTIAMMASFGIVVTRVPGTNKYNIPQGIYNNPPEYLVEADASSATYPLAFAAITGSTVTVTNMGSNSLQGDSKFAVSVLKEMGCSVEQTPITTTVKGPDRLIPLPSIDMESMTDAFMTAAVLAAVAQSSGNNDGNTTRITGIANQRVKECDRIAAMIQQLRFFGVTASELPDGIEVHGIDRSLLKHSDPQSGVYCFDDHRIAMSFSILACAVDPSHGGGVMVTEKKCVEKTWPAWWDVLETVLGVNLSGVDFVPQLHGSGKLAAADLVDTPHLVSDTSILLVGMRGAGKTHMGRAAAKFLGREFIDMDVYLEKTLSMTIPELIKDKGWEEFRRLETQFLSTVLAEHTTGTIIASGGGVVESIESRKVINSWNGMVVHVRRNIDEIEQYLRIDKTRPSYGEDIRSVFARREPLYTQCSGAEFVVPNHSDSADAIYWSKVEQAFKRFLTFKLQHSTPDINSMVQSPSFFVSLTFPNVISAAGLLEKVTEGATAIELRVDLLESIVPEFVGAQVAMLRHLSCLPIVYTVRTKSQGGNFPDSEFSNMITLLESGIRWGCEYIDVEISAPFKRFSSIFESKGNSLIIGSYHDCNGAAIWDDQRLCTRITGSVVTLVNPQPPAKKPRVADAVVYMRKVYQDLYTYSDIIKLIGFAHSSSDNTAVSVFREQIVPSLGLPPKPLIALMMGSLGQLSRVLNTVLTPVTHAAMPTPAASGQLTISQIHGIRHAIGVLPKRQFFLFGKPIATSMSPMLHNTGFAKLGLPHQYSLAETDSWQHVRDIITKGKSDGSFGGASVTIPLKVDVLKHGIATVVSDAAYKIGAINTLHLQDDGSITGNNTDWIGIRRCIERHIGTDCERPVIGIVIGAGGTARAACYALSQLSYVRKVCLWNRTSEKARVLAAEFGYVAVENLNEVLGHHDGIEQPMYAIIGTVPAAAQDEMDLDALFTYSNTPSCMASGDAGHDSANSLSLPICGGGVVVEMAYRPRQTPLLIAAQNASQALPVSPWKCVEGIDVLIAQGLEQFKIWTNCPPPAAAMSEAVYHHYQ
ncbi:3-phosphoshikimate 1-carboxyvinyltransferase [Batrachochytrium salamandrivorans]|nr:3-phosphoshikimate 1-carboxyvinyltransferase [Batrachochytrium salamandrivorans]